MSDSAGVEADLVILRGLEVVRVANVPGQYAWQEVCIGCEKEEATATEFEQAWNSLVQSLRRGPPFRPPLVGLGLEDDDEEKRRRAICEVLAAIYDPLGM